MKNQTNKNSYDIKRIISSTILAIISIPILLTIFYWETGLLTPSTSNQDVIQKFEIFALHIPLVLTIIPSIFSINIFGKKIKKKDGVPLKRKEKILLLLPLLYIILLPIIGLMIRSFVPSIAQAVTIVDVGIKNDPFCCSAQPETVLTSIIMTIFSFIATILMIIPWILCSLSERKNKQKK